MKRLPTRHLSAPTLRTAPSTSVAGPCPSSFAFRLTCLFILASSIPATAPADETCHRSEARPYWVFFRDKGPIELDDQTMLRAARSVSPEAWARRSAAGSSLPTVHDIDLWEPYVDAVAREGRLRRRTRWLNGVSAELTPDAVARLQDLDFVMEVRPVAVGRRQGIGPEIAPDGTPLGTSLDEKAPPPDGRWPYGPSFGQLLEIGALGVHEMGFSGNRVRMMILDTGFRKDHMAFAQTDILAEWDFVFDDGDTQDEADDYPGQHNHGTGCWAVAGGYDPGRIVGPAFGATFVLAKTEDIRSETQAEEDNYVAALEWADELGVAVTSASLTYVCFDDGFCYDYPFKDGKTAVTTRAVNIAVERGILCVNAIGNYGSSGLGSLGTPADANSTLAVGAVDSLNWVASWSSRGPTDDGRIKPEVMARGVQTWWASAGGSGAYRFANGTSLAAPLVGGAAALLAEAHPEWGPIEIREALMMTADRAAYPDNDFGWGRINLEAALHWAPLRYPSPFDLVAPDEGTTVSELVPTFMWERSSDPDSNEPLSYAVRIREDEPGGREWLIDAGAERALALPFTLEQDKGYLWDVLAEDRDGLVRVSRRTRRFATADSIDAPSPPDSTEGPVSIPLRVTASPNPFTHEIRFEAEGADAGASWRIYDPLGRRVASGDMSPAGGGGAWDGRDSRGNDVPSGVYYLWVRSGSRLARTALVRIRGG